MHDVAERTEVGLLNFERVFEPQPNALTVDVLPAFGLGVKVSKLIIHVSGTSAESGVILKVQTGEEMVIVAGTYPYSLAIQGLMLSHPNIFQPEYPLERYDRVPIT